MAYGLIWSDQAERDVADIATYLEGTASLRVAKLVLRAIENKAVQTCNFPMAARIVPEFGDPMRRETFTYSYRIMYRIETNAIRILRVVHGRRLLVNVPGSFEESEQEAYAAL
jgi:toxin ParE1/3/4